MPGLLALASGSALLLAGLAVARRADVSVAGRLSEIGPASGEVPMTAQRSVGARLAPWAFAADERLHRRLALAGRDDAVEAHLASRRRGALLGAIAGAALAGGGFGAVLLGPVLATAGFRIPDIRLARLVRRRQARIAGSVGDLCEILAACVASGLGPGASLELAAGGLRGPLAEELRRALGLLGVGARWRHVLDELCDRADAPGLRRLRSSLEQTERLGTSLEGALRELAREERAARRAAAEARARAAPVKLLFPLALLILPAFLLLTVVPVVLATLRSLG